MKKKGFTLIELLAVIVILAIIALIATPIVMNVIESSRKGAAERSYENYLRAVETAIAKERINGPVEDGIYQINDEYGVYHSENDEISFEVEVSGTKPALGSTVEIENGLIKKGENTTLKIGDYTVNYDTSTNKVVAKIIKLKKFTIGGSTEHTFEEGMTWGEFIQSSYNRNNKFRIITEEELEEAELGGREDLFDSENVVYDGDPLDGVSKTDLIKAQDYEIII